MRVFLFSIGIIFSMCVQGQPKILAHTDFRKADSIAGLYSHYSLKNPGKLATRLTTSLQTEEEKFRAIYRWVCDNIEYDYSLFLKNKQKLKLKDKEALADWNKNFSALVFKNLRDRQKTVCTGYAYLVKTLASHAGIKCVIVDGYGRTTQSNIAEPGTANHSWNAVRLNNKWYLCDPTWSSGAYDTRTSKFEKNFNEVYFLSDPSTFIRNHYPLNSDWILLKEKPTLHEFLTRPVVSSP